MSPLAGAAALRRNDARYTRDRDEWYTPPEVFDPLQAEFGPFTLDPCATAESARAPRFYTRDDDGLSKCWRGERVFCNPPYGARLAAWVAKCAREAMHGAFVVGLLPASTDLGWWHEHVLTADELRYLRGRVKFRRPGGGA